ncbi:MAG: hypothetical protein MUF71_02205 [Candidatus Kapabacteria bacterium]|jgi:hypothetical protein|nr:hypothetical protein [Candidatus Kapabacteria bacterium]
MKKHIYHFLCLAVFCLVIQSCTSGSIGSNSNEIVDISTVNAKLIHKSHGSSLTMTSAIIPPDPWIAGEKRDQLFREYQGTNEDYIVSQFAKSVVKMESWQQVHIAAQECINKTSQGYYAFYAHQLVASTMLTTYFLLEKPTPEVQKAVGYYMDILAKYNNFVEPNVKSAMLSMLIGYWSESKIKDFAQKSYAAISYNLATEKFLQNFYQLRHNDLLKQLPDQYSALSASQAATKIEEALFVEFLTFPKRSKPFPNWLNNWEEYKQSTQDKPESIAILALLAQGKFATTSKK